MSVELLFVVIFKFLNFAALMGLFVFIFKKYFRSDIEAAIEHEHLVEVNLNTRISEMEHRSSELSEDIIKQKKLCEYLIARTAEWKVAFEKDVEQRRHEQKELQKQAAKRAEQQVQTIAHERMIKSVLPKALEYAHNQLTESFKSPAQGKGFVQDILNHMEKSL